MTYKHLFLLSFLKSNGQKFKLRHYHMIDF
jgi:hypothetical protein